MGYVLTQPLCLGGRKTCQAVSAVYGNWNDCEALRMYDLWEERENSFHITFLLKMKQRHSSIADKMYQNSL